jgi:7-carboxy-7-deazaguanine synthase
MTLKVNEIFYSLQGESSYAGLPCVFIRLTGCNLRCTYCDTQYAYDDGREYSIGEVMDKISSYNCNLVEVTGGEPLIQRETPNLVDKLLGAGYRVLLETNGSQDISLIDNRCVRIVDIKCPSSGEEDNNDLNNFNRLTNQDELKFIIGDLKDFEYAKGIINIVKEKYEFKGIIQLSPSFGKLAPNELAGWILNDRLRVRLNLQLHKYIWDSELKGV